MFKLASLEADKHLPWLQLTCVFLVFLLKCCNVFSLKPTGLMCDGRFPASSPPGGSRRLFLRFSVSMGPTLCVLFDPRCCFARITMLTSHVLQRSCSEMPHACKWDLCPWIGLLILLADSILPDPRFLLRFPAANNNSVLFQLLHTPAGDRVLFKHNRRYYDVPQGGKDVATSFPKACDVLLGTPGAW